MNIPDSMPVLAAGAHSTPKDGACVMEYISLLAGETWTDLPKCTNDVLARLAQMANDYLPDVRRNEAMIPLIPRLMGTIQDHWIDHDLLTLAWELTQQDCVNCARSRRMYPPIPCHDHRVARQYLAQAPHYYVAPGVTSALGRMTRALGYPDGGVRLGILTRVLDYYDSKYRTEVVEPTVERLETVNTVLAEARA